MSDTLGHRLLLAAVASTVLCVASAVAHPTEMALAPAGEFMMGDTFGEGESDEQPVHAVYVSPFYMDRYEVTNAQYAAGLNWAWAQGNLITVASSAVYQYGGTSHPYCHTTTSGSYSRITWNGSTFGVVAGKENHPMVQVSWYGSVAYCNWRSAMEGRTPCYDLATWTCDFDADGFRLPTEAEWEKAARGGVAGQRYPHGDTISCANANYSWCVGQTAPVGSYTPNGQGLHDMAGNAWEWCNDWYGATYYSSSPYNNPTGPVSGSHRVLRGGYWLSPAYYCRVAIRNAHTPGDLGTGIGIRCASGTYWAGCPDPPPENSDGDQEEVSGSDADPVNTATGNFYHQVTDLTAPTRGGMMVFTRYYNSAAAAGAKERETEGMHAMQDTKVAGSPANCGVERLGEQVAADIQLHEVSLAVFMVAVSGFGAVCWLVRRTLNIGMRASESQATPQHHLDSTRRAEG